MRCAELVIIRADTQERHTKRWHNAEFSIRYSGNVSRRGAQQSRRLPVRLQSDPPTSLSAICLARRLLASGFLAAQRKKLLEESHEESRVGVVKA